MTVNRTIELTADDLKAAVAQYIAANIEDADDCHTAYDMDFHSDGSVTCKCEQEVSV